MEAQEGGGRIVSRIVVVLGRILLGGYHIPVHFAVQVLGWAVFRITEIFKKYLL